MSRNPLASTAGALALATLAAGCIDVDEPSTSSTTQATESPPPIELPIEVMPDSADGLVDPPLAEHTVARTIHLGATDAAALANGVLYLRGHGLAYRDGSDPTHAKGSVRWDGGGWVELRNANVHLRGADKLYGGIGGGFRTVAMTIPIASLCAGAGCYAEGDHVVELRWNGTDGTGSGYRIIELNVRAADDAPDLLPDSAFHHVDPELEWTPPRPAIADRQAGEALWRARNRLYEQPGSTDRMIAACADCHAQDGRDLEYYAYSNASIVNRSVFHGLTIEEGEQIASYVRSHPVARRGRPWNPPYQPGDLPRQPGEAADAPRVGLDAGGSEWWAAGAGLEAVKPEAPELLDRLFPDGLADPLATARQIRGQVTSRPQRASTINLREIPIALQLPDWNSWLPEVHPLDLWATTDPRPLGITAVATTATTAAVEQVAAGDLDGDGDPELAMAMPAAGASTVQLRRGGDQAAFDAPIPVAMGNGPIAVALADVDGDGDLDVAAANATGGDVAVRRGDGAGGLGALQARLSGASPRALAAGDFNGDGRADLAVALAGASRVAVHLSAADGRPGLPSLRQLAAVPVDLAVGDLDDVDGLDVVVAETATSVQVLSGRGDGTLAPPQLVALGAQPQAIALGDVDGDGRLDLVAAAPSVASVVVVRRTATGGYAAPERVAAADAADVALADLDDDGDLDLAVTTAGASRQLALFAGDGAGGFTAGPTAAVGADPTALVLADVDRDGVDDAVVSNRADLTYTVLRGSGCPTGIAFTPAAAYCNQRQALKAFDRTDPAQVHALPVVVGRLTGAAGDFIQTGATAKNGSDPTTNPYAGYRTTRGAVLDDAVLRGYTMELVKRSLAQWVAVKSWEAMQEFRLEELGPQVFDTTLPDGTPVELGEALSWPFTAQWVVFQLAPHIIAADRNDYDRPDDYALALHDACRYPDDLRTTHAGCMNQQGVHQNDLKGDYDSTAWYHLEVLLQAGARSRHSSVDDTSAVVPVDWPYVLIHIDDLARAVAGNVDATTPRRWESIRYLAMLMKIHQMRDNRRGPALTGWSMRDVSPRLLVSNFNGDPDRTELLARLDELRAGTRAAITEGFLQAFSEITAPVTTWPRFDGASTDRDTWWRLDPEDVVVTECGVTPVEPCWEDDGDRFTSNRFTHAVDLYGAIPLLRDVIGRASPQDRVDALRTWASARWPDTDWSTR